MMAPTALIIEDDMVDSTQEPRPARLVRLADRIIIKVGSSVSTSHPDAWRQIAADVAALQAQRKRVALVASGAVALGREGRPGMAPPRVRRAWASVGQMKLTARVERSFDAAGLRPAQVLVRHADSLDEASGARIAHLLDDLGTDGSVPVVNEDDCNRLEGACFADNDQLAAWLGRIWRAQLIVFLTDVDGVYDRDPSSPDQAAQRIECLDSVRLKDTAAGGPGAAGKGTGGMHSKIDAARAALGYGCSSIITCGLRPSPLAHAQRTAACTVVEERTQQRSWPGGQLEVTHP
ncbi:amino acid kinase family protein [Sorangium sp. So ce1151]|uniref:amino acid kinase family protein n=1 Tax=Sorangium sp. So ce1151 TaxID=3133332 RepID=UPI003F60A935